MLFILLLIVAGGTYVAYSLNLLGPMMQMSSAAWGQASDIGKQRLREFLENNETARQAISMPPRNNSSISRKCFSVVSCFVLATWIVSDLRLWSMGSGLSHYRCFIQRDNY